MKLHATWAFPDADDFMASEMHADGTYQGSHLFAALEYVKDFTLALDGGAHVGTWSKLMAARFERVIAVEPSQDTFEALQENMRTFACDNVECRNVALGSLPGLVHMELEPKAEALKNTGGRFVRPGGTIPVETIDSWALPSLGFLKLDVEGSEVDALEGAAKTLRRCKPIVLFENKGFWRRYGLPKEAPQTLLTGLGFRQVAIAGCDRIWSAT